MTQSGYILPIRWNLTFTCKTGQIRAEEPTYKIAGTPPLADIFVSYASEDRARIEPLVGQLESAGYSVWWDREQKGGTQFSAEIEGALTKASVVLVAWLPNALKDLRAEAFLKLDLMISTSM
jgi:hypothetical protein